MAKSWFRMKARGDGASADISIYSEIGGWGISAQSFHDQLTALGNVKELRLSISSEGGDVFVGNAIFNMLKRHPANKVVRIEGLAASMASVIAMAGDEIEMPANAMMMIHNPWGGVVGESDQIVSFGEALQKMRLGIADAYAKRTGLKRSEILAMMDKETWLSAKEAVAKGFADRVEKPIQMAANYDISRFNNVPAKFGRLLKEQVMTKRNQNAAAAGDEFEGEVAEKTESEIRQELLAHQKEIRSLCTIAGKPELADGFVNEDKSVADVIAALAELREKESKTGADSKKEKGAVSARHNPTSETSTASIDPVAIYDRWNKRKNA